MTRIPSGPLAALALVVGYVVADTSGVRALGGAVMLLGLAGCIALWRRRSWPVAAALSGVFLLLFVTSHLLARAIGAYPAVSVVAAAMWVVAAVVADRRPVGRQPVGRQPGGRQPDAEARASTRE